ncbi:hypothetical protein NQ317_000764 [Molorchus minor]|uniref:Secreted protein n=1 Tax=Molorchus minor TaxID=1323400 RepID=A0ABQ9J2Q6_9CUCU|nr:hypothetical protein NQ317_000764 [Molorchus minor]
MAFSSTSLGFLITFLSSSVAPFYRIVFYYHFTFYYRPLTSFINTYLLCVRKRTEWRTERAKCILLA